MLSESQFFKFTSLATAGYARAGTFTTPHGIIETPTFMPVGTQATVKGLTREQVKSVGTQIALANTYHLHLRPGDERIARLGGLHDFMNVDYPLLTDSGGFQVFSLGMGARSGQDQLVKITEDGVHFRSHLDGSKLYFSPERAMEIQSNLGADIIMAFDECAPGDSSESYARSAMDRTHRWALRCVTRHEELQSGRREKGLHPQALFPIAQGVVYPHLRRESTEFIAWLPCPGIGIGGLSVGESKADMYGMLDAIANVLPPSKPHYLMWVGTPQDLIEGIARGIDMFDCVLPTRLARHGGAFSCEGDLRLTNEKFRDSSEGIPCEDELQTSVSKTYSLAYLSHLYRAEESLAGTLVSMHNLEYLILLTQSARRALIEGRFDAWYASMAHHRKG